VRTARDGTITITCATAVSRVSPRAVCTYAFDIHAAKADDGGEDFGRVAPDVKEPGASLYKVSKSAVCDMRVAEVAHPLPFPLLVAAYCAGARHLLPACR